MLQDFVKGWMTEFVTRSWDVLQHGVGSGNGSSRDEKVLFVTVLFQLLTDATNACLPHALTSLIGTPPPSPWPFIAETSEAVFAEIDKQSEGTARKFQKGAGK